MREGALNMRNSEAGFSLVEILIVAVLMILMYVMLYGPATKFYHNQKKAECAHNLAQVYIALKIYASENSGNYPAKEDAATSEAPLSLLVPRCTTVTECFICPGSGDRSLSAAEPFEKERISYAYYMGLTDMAPGNQPLVTDRQVDEFPKPKGQRVFSGNGKKPGANHHKYGGIFLFCDGRVVDMETEADRDLPCPKGVRLLNPKE
jgi:type II secretory pathway pseudopilin PulG